MKQKTENKSYDKIKNLIEIENNEALKNFDSLALKRDVIKSIEERNFHKSFWSTFFNFNYRRLAPVTMVIFLVVTTFVTYNYISEYSSQKSFNRIERVFSALPGLKQTEIKPEIQADDSTNHEFIERLSQVLRRGIYSPDKKQYSKAQLEKIFFKGLSANVSDDPLPDRNVERIKTEHFNLEERVNKLIQNKKLNQFFVVLKTKEKEA